jgi:hypothetical protein
MKLIAKQKKNLYVLMSRKVQTAKKLLSKQFFTSFKANVADFCAKKF